MSNKFPSDIAGDAADCGAPSCTLDDEAGAGAEFRDREDPRPDWPLRQKLSGYRCEVFRARCEVMRSYADPAAERRLRLSGVCENL